MSAGPRIWVLIAVSVLIGTPIVAVLWETLNELLAGEVNTRHVALAVPAALIAVFLTRLLARTVARLDPRTAATPSRSQTESP